MYARQAIEIMEKRGFSPQMMTQFFNVYPDKGDKYTEEMIDTFEYSVNGPAFDDIHPDVGRKI